MTFWLALRIIRRAPRRLFLGALGVAFPVAMFAATVFFVEDAARQMIPVALEPVQIEMRALATSLDVNMRNVSQELASTSGVQTAEPFGSVNVVVTASGTAGGWTARLFAVDPSYLRQHPWLRLQDGTLGRGALLDQALRNTSGFASAKTVTIGLPGDAPKLSLKLPVDGTIDLRQATTWFAIPYGEVQGDIVTLPRAIVIDYATFEKDVLPVLKRWEARGGLPPFDPGSDELPPATLESHITVSRTSYPPDPARAAGWSTQLRHILETRSAGAVLVADNASEPLTEAETDATNARTVFLLLGIPGVLVAGALGLAASSALAESQRREEALLRLRGATSGQIARVAGVQAALAGLVGSVIGLAAAAAVVSAVTRRPVWRGEPITRLVLWSMLALAVGAVATLIRLIRLRRASLRSEVAQERRILERGWSPFWKRYGLDLVAIAIGIAILTINVWAGGLRPNPIEGSALALSFFVLLAPIAIWLGIAFLGVRVLLGILARRARPARSRSLPSWSGAMIRWLGRRPARTAVVLALGALAVAFGTEVLTFSATYRTARATDAHAAIGSDLRLVPGDPSYALPPLGSEVASVSPFRLVPARVGGDRKTILTIDLSSYRSTTTMQPLMLTGSGPEGLQEDPTGVLVSEEIRNDFALRPGDPLPLVLYPDDFENSTKLKLRVVGVYRSFPPTAPTAELVMATTVLPRTLIVPPDFYLARVSPNLSSTKVATDLQASLADRFGVSTVGDPTTRGLTALDLSGMARIESLGAGLIAAFGVAVLGAFLVLERRREFAILRAIGADTAQIGMGPALEGTIAVLGSLVIGVPLGVGLGVLAVRVLGLFFTLPPPLLTFPSGALFGFSAMMVVASALAMAITLMAVSRVRPASVLREQL